MYIIDLNIDLTSINDEKTVSGITLSKYIITFFSFSKDHWFGDLLDFLIFKGGEKLVFRETFKSKLYLLFLQIIP